MHAKWVEDTYLRKLEVTLRAPEFSDAHRKALTEIDRRSLLRGDRPATRWGRVMKARGLARFLRKPFPEATRADLEEFLADVAKRNAPATLCSMKLFLKAFYKDLLMPGKKHDPHPPVVNWIVLESPLSVEPSKPLVPVGWNVVERMISKTPHPRDKAIIGTFFESMGRRSELASTTIRKLLWDPYGVRVVMSGKGKAKPRPVRLFHSAPLVRQWMDMHPDKDNPDAPVFVYLRGSRTKPLGLAGLYAVVKKAAARAGLTQRMYPHLLRHSRITDLRRRRMSDAATKAIAGWSKNSPMLQVYDHTDLEDADKELLETEGIAVAPAPERDSLIPMECPRCKKKNPATVSFCEVCKMPLRDKELAMATRVAELVVDNKETLGRLLELLGDEEVATLVRRKSRGGLPKHSVKKGARSVGDGSSAL